MSRLDATASRLRALLPAFPDTYAVETVVPDGPGWWGVDALPIERWCADARERGHPARLASLAAVSVGTALAQAVLGRVTAALALDMCAWDVAADNLVVHRAGAGHLDRIALRRPAAWVVAGPRPPGPALPAAALPAAALPVTTPPTGSVPTPAPPTRREPNRPPVAWRPDPTAPGRAAPAAERVFPDETALLDGVAATAVATLTPLLHRVRAATRFGLVPLWNSAADTVRLTATFVPLHAGLPARPALAPALLDALVAHGAPVRGRGQDQPLPGRPDRVPVRAACCLSYRTDPPVAHPSDALCTTCLLLDPASRAHRYGAFLDGITAASISAGDR